MTVKTEDGGGGLLIAANDFRHIAQIDQTVRAPSSGADQEITEFLLGLELSGGVDREIVGAQADVPGAGRQVLGSEGVVDVLLCDAELRHLVATHLDVDDLGSDSVEFDTFDILGAEQLALEELRVLIDLVVGVSLSGDGHIDPIDIAEIIVDVGRSCAGRQTALGVVHLAAELVPHLRQRVLVVLVLDFGFDEREAPI